MSKKFKMILNKKFGKLTAIEFLGRKDRKTYWKCRCECGRFVEIQLSSLTTGNSKSCGICVKIGNKRSRKLPKGLALLYKVYRFYKKNAEIRKLTFKLTDQDFFVLIKSNCYYCNIPPFTKIPPPKTWSDEWKKCNTANYNGIDRVDNSKGYQLDNCVPCCKICNRAKKDLSVKDFNDWLQKLITYNSHRNVIKGKSNEDS